MPKDAMMQLFQLTLSHFVLWRLLFGNLPVTSAVMIMHLKNP